MGKSSPGKRNNVSSWRKILPASARRLLGHLAQTIGLRAGGSRKVRFQASTSVFEFERQLLGGGGVPDGDTVALGLGPKCVNTSVVPLTDKDDKDEYASTGYLDVSQRTRLLSEWAPSMKASKAQLEKARPEIERLQRAREESASSPRDQRYMPSNVGEALLVASRDEEEALEAAKRSSRKSSSLMSRALSTRAGRAARSQERASPQCVSQIAKKRISVSS